MVRKLGAWWSVVTATSMAVTACTSDPPTVTPALPTPDPLAGPTADPLAAPYTLELVNTEIATGLERVAFRLRDAGGAYVRDGQVTVEFYRTLPGGQKARDASGEALYFGAGMPDGGAWVAYSTFDASGAWDLNVAAVRADGSRGQVRTQIEVAGRTLTPRVGIAPPSAQPPVLAPGGDVAALTSDPDPDPALYSRSIETARTSGNPTVVFFGSPAHCPTDLCRATLEEVKAVKNTYKDRINVIHVETLDPANPDSLTPAAAAWGVKAGPWLFVIDRRGLVSARVEGAIDRTELGLLVDRALGGS